MTIHVDPSCPFAWIASRWLVEVEAILPIDLSFGLMSISVLNEGRELEPWYREFNDRAWRPARVHAAVLAAYGVRRFRELYEAFGHLHHVERNDDALERALDSVGLPDELMREAGAGEYDAFLRSSHHEAVDPLGGEAGTPTIHLGEKALFGPVLTEIPRGQQAVELFHAVRTLADFPAWSELKRPRADELTLS